MNIQDNRETANKAVREWKSHHQQTYSDFKRQVRQWRPVANGENDGAS